MSAISVPTGAAAPIELQTNDSSALSAMHSSYVGSNEAEGNMDVDSIISDATSVNHPACADFDTDMSKALMLLRSSIRDASLIIAAAPPDVDIANQRTLLANKLKDLKMMKAIVGTMNEMPTTSNRTRTPTSGFASVTPSSSGSDSTQMSRTIVPRDMPLFQWEGQVFNRSRQVFADIKACIQNFEDIMISHCLSIDANYLRLLPTLLSPTARIWFDDFVTTFRSTTAALPTWSDFSIAIIARYGVNSHEERVNSARELNQISMHPGESIENFIDRFNTLRRRAVDQVLPNSILIDRFCEALPTAIYEKVDVAVTPLGESKRSDLDTIFSFARNFFNKFHKKKISSVASSSASSVTPGKRVHDNAASSNGDVHASSSRSKYAHTYTPGSGSSTPRVGTSASVSSHRRVRREKFCTFHNVHTHDTANCRAAKEATGSTPKGQVTTPTADVAAPTTAQCFKCGVDGWTRGHRCNTAVRRIHSAEQQDDTPHRFAGMTLAENDTPSSVSSGTTIPTSVDDASSSSAADTASPNFTSSDMDVDISLDTATMLSQQAQACKFHEVFSIPPSNKSNMIIIPVVIENIKTYAMLDTGSTFSSLTPEFASAIKAKITPASGVVQLGHASAIEDRNGSTSLKIFYNNKIHIHSFEIFETFTTINNKNIPCLVGMDLMSTLQIGITGLVLSHFDIDRSNPFPPSPIDPASIKPNESPYGTHDERTIMNESLKPLLKENSEIDIKSSYCNLPGAIIQLPTKKGCVAFTKQYPLPYAFKDAVCKQIKTWVEEGVLEPAPTHTGFNSPLLVVSKKDLDGVYSFKKPRVVADVRNLNSILQVTDTQSLPLISEIHARLGNATIHSIIDIRSCFNSFLVTAEDRHKLAVTCPYTNRQYCFKKSPFGLTFVGNLVQRVLQELFHDLSYIQVYVDDLTISTSGTLVHHTSCVAEVLRRLTKANLVISPEKMVLAQTSIHLLGWSVVNGALLPDPRKVNTALHFPIPKTTRALNSFLGYMNFFRSSIPLYAHISSCLDKLRNAKDITEHWTEVHTTAVRNLQKALASAPLIHTIDYKYPLHVATDASNTGISGVLYMRVGNEIRYVAMASRALSGSELYFSTTRKEILAIVYCFKRFSKWLVNKPFTLHTDHRSLIYLHSQEVPNHLLLTYYEVLFSYSYSVVHLPGHLNSIADAGSRLFLDDFKNLQGGKLVDETISSFILKRQAHKIKAEQSRDAIVKRTFKKNKTKFKPQLNISSTFYKKAMKQHIQHHSQENKAIKNLPRSLTTGSNNVPIKKATRKNKSTSDNVPLINSALQYADYITPPKKERDDIINRAHFHGHFGIKAVETTIHRDYNMHWTNMRDDIQRIISTCDACSHFNIAKVGYHPFRSVLPDQPLDHWSLDLGTFNTTSASGNNYMLVMVDHFSRFTILRALPDKSSLTIAKELLNIFCLFSFPRVLSHDNGSEFINEIVSQLVLLSGIDRRLSLPYTPQGNSVCERFVGIAKASIVKMLNGKHDDWDLYLNSVQLAMNIKYSKLHKSRPFTIVFNRQPNGFEDYSKVRHTLSTEKADVKLIDDRLAFAQQVVIPEITKLIKATQDRDHEKFAKTHKIIENMYPIGSSVMILNVHRSSKLQESYSGPFQIKGYTKNKSYILIDQQGNLLSRDVPTHHIKLVSTNAASQNATKEGHFEVQAIIKHRGTPGNYNYLVHWLGYDKPEDHTWQTEQDFDSKMHIELYWDRLNSGSTSQKTIPASVNNTTRKRPNRDRHSNKNAKIVARAQTVSKKETRSTQYLI